jgi:electron transfer flavoprotein alpha subunit
MRALVFLEHSKGGLDRGSLGVLCKAASLAPGQVSAVVVGGPEVKELASEAGRFGASKVYVAVAGSVEAPLSQPRVDVIEQLVTQGDYDSVLFSNSVLAADVAAGLAARLDAGINWDLVDVEIRSGSPVGRRLGLGDSVRFEVGWRSDKRILLFRAGSFEVTATDGAAAAVEEIEPQVQDRSLKARFVEQRVQTDTGPSLEDAEVIVSGGMGLGSAENFSLAEGLARVLGGVVGATRAAVYAGWYPHSAQVGQTGKTVAPKLYVALGISGAVQHKVGMQNAKTIVAINSDPAAPIFEFSDLAVVGDLHSIVPRLVELVEQRKGR